MRRWKSEVRSPKAEGRPKSEGRSPKCGGPLRDWAGWNGSLTLADFYPLPIRDALPFIEALAGRHQRATERSTRPGPERSPLAPGLPRRGRPGLSHAGSSHAHALGRRDRAGEPHHLPGHAAGEHAVRAGRAERGPAPARHRTAGPPARATARRRQHRGGGRTRGQRDPRGGPDRGPRPRPRRDGRGDRVSGHLPAAPEIEEVPHRPISQRPQAN